MSTTMRSTLQTVPESLPADHVTSSSTTTGTPIVSGATATEKISSHSHSNSVPMKLRSSTAKVSQIFS